MGLVIRREREKLDNGERERGDEKERRKREKIKRKNERGERNCRVKTV